MMCDNHVTIVCGLSIFLLQYHFPSTSSENVIPSFTSSARRKLKNVERSILAWDPSQSGPSKPHSVIASQRLFKGDCVQGVHSVWGSVFEAGIHGV